MRKSLPSAVAITVLAALGGCAEGGSEADAPAATVTVTETASPVPSPTSVETSESVSPTPTPKPTPESTSPVPTAAWGPFEASTKPGLSFVSAGLERPRPPYESYSSAGAVGFNNGPEHFSVNVTFQIVKDGFVTQSATELVAYIPADSFFAVGALLDPVAPEEELKVVVEDGTLVDVSVPAEITVEALATDGDSVPIRVTTDTTIPQGAPAYLVYVGDQGEILGGGSAVTNVTMRAGVTTPDALDTLLPPKGTTDVYVTIDRLSMM